MTAGQAADLLGEGGLRAGWSLAQKAPDGQADQHLPAARGSIEQSPLIPAVHPPDPGHAADRLHVLPRTRTDMPPVKTCSTSMSARCGGRTSATSRSHGQHDHKNRDQGTA
jgi:hypothetical protein